MQNIMLKNFGVILTGRPYGVQIYSELQKEYGNANEVEFDLSGVASLGSSFGEEVIVPFAKKQGNKVTIHSANAPVRSCIQLIAKDFNLVVDFK
jgi:hypothetical protein